MLNYYDNNNSSNVQGLTVCQVGSHLLRLGKLSLRSLSKARAKIEAHILGLQRLCLVPYTTLAARAAEPMSHGKRAPELNVKGLK